MKKRAIVLLSGGLDSTTTLGIAANDGYDCYAITFRYGQRHEAELACAKKIAAHFGVRDHVIVNIDLRAFGGSALTSDLDVPKNRNASEMSDGIPSTYVPARNTIFLSFALAMAESRGIRDIFIGVNAIDYSGYPDCRPEYIAAFQAMGNLATKAGVEGDPFAIHTPLIDLQKADIIKRGLELGIDYALTCTCYDPDLEGNACGQCDACSLRLKGFAQNGIKDPAAYRPIPPSP